MPVKRRVAKRIVGDVDAVFWAYLTDDPELAAEQPDGMSFFFCDWLNAAVGARPQMLDYWQHHGADITEQWAEDRPGTRPRCWWAFTAPRAPATPALPLKRVQTGGSGVPMDYTGQHPGNFPHLVVRFGLPTEWAREPSRGAPAIFESEAAYLLRHGLFLPGEQARLSGAAFKPVVVADGPPTWFLPRRPPDGGACG
jgi:hypothetical protein